MINKQVLPESFDFGMPSVEIVNVGSKGLDKTAMVKRASAFDDILDKIEKKANRTYLHVITTGAYENLGCNANADGWNGDYMDMEVPYPEDDTKKVIHLDGGLKKYHNSTYMKDGAVYQEHQTKTAGVDPSGEIIAARYNDDMHRGELIIAVDNDKWRDRLQKKASGKDIYLSIGASVPYDTCFPKGTLVLTNTGYVAIEDIRVGDVVKTSSGAWQTVTNTMHRYTDKLTRLEFKGLPIDLDCTPNHPIQIVRYEKILSCIGNHVGDKSRRHNFNGEGICTTCNKKLDLEAEWVSAGDIRPLDFLKIRVDTNAPINTVGESFAYLCGMYVGDGSLSTKCREDGYKNIYGLYIAASAADKDKDILDRIRDCFYRVTAKPLSISPHPHAKAFQVRLNDKRLAVRIADLCWQGSKYKQVPEEIFGWSAREKAAFLAGLIDSDGCMCRMSLRICTINRGMALAVQRLFWSIGCEATAYISCSSEHMERTTYKSSSCMYAVSTSRFNKDLWDLSAKLHRIEDLYKHRSSHTFMQLDQGFAYVRINDVRTFDCDPIMVYNIEVEGDHTYNAEGIDVHNCNICGHKARTSPEHCEHFHRHRGQLFDCGKVACVMNDKPSFYDISGVNVPADKIAFVLRKMASTDKNFNKTASVAPILPDAIATRPPMLLTKAASLLSKLAEMEKKIEGIIEGDKDVDLEAFRDDDDAKKDFVLRVENYPADEVIDSCNRKGMLLSPGMLFKILGSDLEDDNLLSKCDDACCGDTTCIMQDLDNDEDKNSELLDGSFDQHMPADLNLDEVLNKFLPEFGASDGAINAKIIKITVSPRTKKEQTKEASFNAQSQQALRRTYARYLVSFAERNDDQTCFNALMKVAALSK